MEQEELLAIVERIAAGKHSDGDIEVLREALSNDSKRSLLQLGKYNINIGQGGEGIHIGDRTFVEINDEAIRAITENIAEKQHAFTHNETTQNRNLAESSFLRGLKYEVDKQLADATEGADLLSLGKQTRPDLVWDYHSAKAKFSVKSGRSIKKTTTILEMFDHAQGKILLLGKPGSGKTTQLLLLARDLIAIASKTDDYPVPVILELGSWKSGESIESWSVDQLRKKYAYLGKYAKKLVKDRRIIPIFDGLDEVKSESQISCIQEINKFISGECSPQHLVVCSRYDEYRQAVQVGPSGEREDAEKQSLHLNEAILLKSLANREIKEYLLSMSQEDVWQTVSQDSELLSFVRQPLFLSIVRFICLHEEFSIQEWKTLQSSKAQTEYLLDAYWKAAISRKLVVLADSKKGFKSYSYDKRRPPDHSQTKAWLSWLAKKIDDGDSYFLIEEIQPFWIDTKTEYCKYVSLCIVLISFPIALSLTLVQIFKGGLLELIMLFAALIILSKTVSEIDIISVNRVQKLSVENLQKGIKDGCLYGLLSSVVIGLLYGRTRGLVVGVSSGLILIIITTVGAYVQSALTSAPIAENLAGANEGIKRLRYNSIAWPFLGSGIGFVWLAIFVSREFASYLLVPGSTKSGMFAAILFGVNFSLDPITGFCAGLLIGLLLGGITAVKHFSLRVILYLQGDIPWNYANFLDYCTERGFLQRVGGRYKFIHRLFQKHLIGLLD